MQEPAAPEATVLLRRSSAGDGDARDALLRLLYSELRSLAARQMQRERKDHTLQPTVLVHEAWMRLIEEPGQGVPDAGAAGGPAWDGRAHFLRMAAKAMRNVLVDHARRRGAQKRGASAARAELDDVLATYETRALDVLALDEALERLAQRDEELARVVELRFFGGLTVEETGAALGLGVRQVEGAWVTARGWLRRELGERGGP